MYRQTSHNTVSLAFEWHKNETKWPINSFNLSVDEGGGCIELQTQGCQGSP